MIPKTILLLFLFTILSACKQPDKAPAPINMEVDSTETQTEELLDIINLQPKIPPVDKVFNDSIYALWQFETIATPDSFRNVKGDYVVNPSRTTFSVTFPIACPNPSALSRIQQQIEYFFFSEEDNLSGNLKEKLEKKLSQIEAYNYDLKNGYQVEDDVNIENEWDEWEINPEVEKRISVYSIYPKILTMDLYYYTYAGGIHGVYGTYYHNFDTDTGEEITEEKLFKKDYKPLLSNIIRLIIKARNNSSDKNVHINLLGDLETVEPNDNFVMTNKGLVYTYNIYEMSAYVFGPQEITVPYRFIGHLIKDRYLPLIEEMQTVNPVFEQEI